MGNRVYVFGARPPRPEFAQQISDEMHRGHVHFNRMIELWRWRIQQKHELRERIIPGFSAAEAAYRAAEAALASALADLARRNAAARRKSGTQEDRAAIAELRATVKVCRERRRALLGEEKTNPAYVAACGELYEQFREKSNATYAQSRADGCTWGTIGKVNQSVEAAAKNCTVEDLPAFRRWNGDGQFVIQLQKGLSLGEMLSGAHGQVQMFRQNKKPGDRSVTFKLRIGSDESRRPIWVEIDATLNRKFGTYFPKDADIRYVSLVRRRGAFYRHKDGWKSRDSWEIHLTVRNAPDKPTAPSGACGLDFGWRLMADGTIRVALWVDDQGNIDQLRIDPSRWHALEALQGRMDADFERARDSLVVWLSEASERVRQAVGDQADNLVQWKSRGRLTRLITLLEPHGPPNECIYWMRDNARDEQHLFAERRRLLRWRQDIYRNVAARLARRYRDICVEDTNISQIARAPKSDSQKSVNQTANANRFIAAPSYLLAAIQQSGAIVRKVKAEYTTCTCHACGSVEQWDQQAELVHTCEQCGATWDQDENAARNLLARGSMAAETTAPAREAQSDDVSEDAPPAAAPRGRWRRRRQEALARRGQSA